MQIIGIIRKLDALGRVVIPKEYRTQMEIEKHDPVEILLSSSGVFIKKHNTSCCLCGNKERLIDLDKGYICMDCIHKIKKIK